MIDEYGGMSIGKTSKSPRSIRDPKENPKKNPGARKPSWVSEPQYQYSYNGTTFLDREKEKQIREASKTWMAVVAKLGLIYSKMTNSWIDPDTDIRYSETATEEQIIANRDTMLGMACVWCGESFKTKELLDAHEEECND